MNAKPSVVALCLALCLAATVAQAAKRLVRRPKYDPKAVAVDLFEAVDLGKIETSVVAKNPHEASLSITNTSDATVSVKMPQAVVAVQVLKQNFGQGLRGAGQGGPNGGGPGGMAQSIGGGMQGQNMGNQGFMNNGGNAFGNGMGNGFGMGNGLGNGIFSIPPDKTVQVPLRTICLSHGRPDPRPKMTYQLVKLEQYTNDAVLQETLKLFASGGVDLPTAQAAAWHLTDKMSWEELRAKQVDRLGGLDPLPFFSEDELRAADELVSQARANAKESYRGPEKRAEQRAETAAR